MNKISIITVALLLVLVSCRKDVPSDKEGFIGTWQCTSCGEDEIKTIVIKQNGRGSYKSLKPGATLEIAGKVFFDGNDFKIGGAIIRKKFSTDQYPKKGVVSLIPYTYTWSAKFNGDDYKKD